MTGTMQWMNEATRDILQRCRITAHDGTTLYTPDGVANYRALWTRDFSYMVENAGDLLDPADIRAAIGNGRFADRAAEISDFWARGDLPAL